MTGKYSSAFTLIELLVVMFVLSLLAALVAPVVTGSMEQAKEAALKEDLHVIRKAIDDFYSDNGNYPETLDILVKDRYLRHMPQDPINESTDSKWRLDYDDKRMGVRDVHSQSQRLARDGSRYDTW